ncbi:MAG TPA: MerR family transcriptional regulator [Clostridiales bacterium]|nr:MerR family transcriptional regulator [Clostridiales bacterium]
MLKNKQYLKMIILKECFKMKYRISEVAKLLDLSSEAIRYYENKGIIKPERDEETGYRYYGGWEIHMLIRARTYRQLGCSIDETADLLNRFDNVDIISYLDNKREEIKKEIERSTNLLGYLEKEQENIMSSDKIAGEYQLLFRPDIYRLEMQDGYVLHPDKKLRQAIYDWIEKIPYVFSSTVFPLDSVYGGDDNFTVGLGIYKEHAELLGIEESEFVKFFPSRLCVLTGIQTKSSKNISTDLLRPAMDYMTNHGMLLTGDVITKSVLMRKVGEEYVNWHRAWLPFKYKN